METRVKLDDVINGLDLQDDYVTAYLDRNTGAVVPIDENMVPFSGRDEPDELADWERELIEIPREYESGSKRYVKLPSKWDIHEWEIMRRFCDTVEDERVRELLLRAIHGRGAFRRFRNELDRDLLDRWFDFKRSALREQAIAWCIANEIPFK
jgi:hypothetical protein